MLVLTRNQTVFLQQFLPSLLLYQMYEPRLMIIIITAASMDQSYIILLAHCYYPQLRFMLLQACSVTSQL